VSGFGLREQKRKRNSGNLDILRTIEKLIAIGNCMGDEYLTVNQRR